MRFGRIDIIVTIRIKEELYEGFDSEHALGKYFY